MFLSIRQHLIFSHACAWLLELISLGMVAAKVGTAKLSRAMGCQAGSVVWSALIGQS